MTQTFRFKYVSVISINIIIACSMTMMLHKTSLFATNNKWRCTKTLSVVLQLTTVMPPTSIILYILSPKILNRSQYILIYVCIYIYIYLYIYICIYICIYIYWQCTNTFCKYLQYYFLPNIQITIFNCRR